jgi:CubicO group peptidase (beta-lactamase class C family)
MANRYSLSVLTVMVVFGSCSLTDRGPSKADRIQELMERYHSLGRHYGSVLVAQDGEILFEGGFGYANAAWEVANGPTVKYRISSTTKMLTAILVLQLVEGGELDLQAPAASYLLGLDASLDGRITLDHLLTHRSGLPDYANDLTAEEYRAQYQDRRVPADSVLINMVSLPLEFEPGEGWEYSNTGYVVLQLILEAVTGQPFCDLLHERLTGPAAMEDTGCVFYDPVIPRMATGYIMNLDGRLQHAPFDHSIYADGMAYSTVRDLFSLDLALRSGRLLSPAMQQVMNTPRVEDNWIGNDFGEGLKHYTGYGVESIHRRPGRSGGDSITVVGHGGGTTGWSSMLWRVPEEGVVIAILNNLSVPPLPIELFDILFDRPYRLPTSEELEAREQRS